MLPLKHRLPLRNQREFFDVASRRHTRHFVIYFVANDLENARAAVIVPAKVVAKATARNKIRRQITSYLFSNIDKLDGDIVIYVKRIFSKEDLKELDNL